MSVLNRDNGMIEPGGRRLLSRVEPEMPAIPAWVEQTLPEDERTELVKLCERVIAMAASRSGRTLDVGEDR